MFTAEGSIVIMLSVQIVVWRAASAFAAVLASVSCGSTPAASALLLRSGVAQTKDELGWTTLRDTELPMTVSTASKTGCHL